MGLLDNLGGSLGGMLGQVTSAAATGLISAMLAKTNLGDMQGIVSQSSKAAWEIKSSRGLATAATCRYATAAGRARRRARKQIAELSEFRWIRR